MRREQDFTNVEAGRTVTRWEFMEARVNRVMPQISDANLAIGDFLTTPDGLARPAAELLREVRESIASLEHLATADLERLMAEHIDLCSYRLDAWQSALFSQTARTPQSCCVNPGWRCRKARRAPRRLRLARKCPAGATADGRPAGADSRRTCAKTA